MERALDGILEVQRNLRDDLAFEGDSEDDNASKISDEEILSNLIDIDIFVDTSVKISVDDSYVSVDIQPGDALISVNGVRVQDKNHAEFLITAAKQGPREASISLRFLRGVLEDSDVRLLYETSEEQCTEALLKRCLSICDCEFSQGQYVKASQSAMQCLFFARAYQSSDSGKDRLLATCYEKAGYCAKKLGDHDGAIMHFEQALVLVTRLLGSYSLQLIPIFDNLISLYRRVKNYDASFTSSEHLLGILERNEGAPIDHRTIGNTYHSIAFIYRVRKEFAKAESVAVHALELRTLRLGRNHSDVAQSLNFLASLRLERGDTSSETENMYLEALHILTNDENSASFSIQETAMTLMRNISWFYCSRSDYARAEDYKRREIELRLQVIFH